MPAQGVTLAAALLASALAQEPVPLAPAPALAPDLPRVLANQDGSLYIDLNLRQGARAGQRVVLYRTVRVDDVETGRVLEDHFPYGVATLEEVGDTLARATAAPATLARAQIGDVVGLPSAGAPAPPCVDDAEIQDFIQATDACDISAAPERAACWRAFLERWPGSVFAPAIQRRLAAPPVAPAASEPLDIAVSGPDSAPRGAPAPIYVATLSDHQIVSATLYSRREGDRSYAMTAMRPAGARLRRAELDTSGAIGDTIEWFIEVTTSDGHVSRQPLAAARTRVTPARAAPPRQDRTHASFEVEQVRLSSAAGDGARSHWRRLEGAVELRTARPSYSFTLGAGDLSGEIVPAWPAASYSGAVSRMIGPTPGQELDSRPTSPPRERRSGDRHHPRLGAPSSGQPYAVQLDTTYAFSELALPLTREIRLGLRGALGVDASGPAPAAGLRLWIGQEEGVHGYGTIDLQFVDLLHQTLRETWEQTLGEFNAQGTLPMGRALDLSAGAGVTTLPAADGLVSLGPRPDPPPLFQSHLQLDWQAGAHLDLRGRAGLALQDSQSLGRSLSAGVGLRW